MKFAAALAAAGLALAAFAPSHAQTAAWPNKPVRIVVGFAAGTPPDVFARMYGEYASRKLNTPFVIDNKPGSAGNLATDAVAKAPADGYTVLYNVSTAFTINPSIYGKLPFDAEKDLVPLATTMRQGLVLIAGPTFKADSLPLIGSWPEDRLAGTPPYQGPVLWVGGAESSYITDEYAPAMDRWFPHNRRVTVKNAGHWVHSEQPEVFTEVLRRFLR